MLKVFRYRLLLFLAMMLVSAACEKVINLPPEKEYLSPRISFSNKILTAVLGRNNLISGLFNSDNSSEPLKFEIQNVRYGDGTPSNELFQVKPTLVWKEAYTGKEKSLSEIESKRVLEDHPLFEMRPSGDFMLWASATNDLIKPITKFPKIQDVLYFDVKISNSGGERLIKDFQFLPYRMRPYEPHNDLDIYTGRRATDGRGNPILVYPTQLSGMVGDSSDKPLLNDGSKGELSRDAVVYFRKVGNGNSLKFIFLNKDSVPINPARFNNTQWDQVVHGFNMEMTSTYVKYEVAYPIPLVNFKTHYTNSNGSMAVAAFSYSRTGFNNVLEVGTLVQDFSIYEKGDWEIIFFFRHDNPKFRQE